MKLCKHTKKNRCAILDRDVPHDGFECALADTCKAYDSPAEEEMWQFVLVKLLIYKRKLEELEKSDNTLDNRISNANDNNWTWRYDLKECCEWSHLTSAIALMFSILAIVVGFVL